MRPTLWIASALTIATASKRSRFPCSSANLPDLNLRQNYEVKLPGSRACEHLSVKSTRVPMCSARVTCWL